MTLHSYECLQNVRAAFILQFSANILRLRDLNLFYTARHIATSLPVIFDTGYKKYYTFGTEAPLLHASWNQSERIIHGVKPSWKIGLRFYCAMRNERGHTWNGFSSELSAVVIALSIKFREVLFVSIGTFLYARRREIVTPATIIYTYYKFRVEALTR